MVRDNDFWPPSKCSEPTQRRSSHAWCLVVPTPATSTKISENSSPSHERHRQNGHHYHTRLDSRTDGVTVAKLLDLLTEEERKGCISTSRNFPDVKLTSLKAKSSFSPDESWRGTRFTATSSGITGFNIFSYLPVCGCARSCVFSLALLRIRVAV